MKQSISIFVLFVLILSLAPASFAQKGVLLKEKTLARQTTKPLQPAQQAPEVVIAAAEAFTDGHGVFLRWSTARETENLGFYVTRIDKDAKQLVGKFIAGSAMRYGKETIYGEEYSLFDRDGQPDSQYVIDSFLKNGGKVSIGPLSAKYMPDLSPVAGATSKQLALNQLVANGFITSDTPVASKDLQNDIDINSKSTNLTNQRSVASQPGIKFGIRQKGMYRVTKAQMQAAGFDVNSDSTKWQLYANGNEQSIIVGPNGDYIDFFAKGIDTVESDTAMYYLVAGSVPGKRISSFALRPSSSFKATNAPSFVQDSFLKERTGYLEDLLNGPAENYIGDPILSFGIPPTVSFNIAPVDRNVPSAHIVVRLLGYTPGAAHTVNLTLNGQSLGQVTGNGIAPMVFDGTIAASALLDGQNTLKFTAVSTGDVTFIDSVEVVYNRRHVASQNNILFTTSGSFDTELEGFTSSNIRVFDITNDGDPVRIKGLIISPNGGTFDANIPAYRDRLMVGVEDSGLLTPASITLNNPSTLSTSNHNANLVIISYKDFMTQANAWADYRRNQGFTVEVVNVEDIYDEFNYGVLSAQSVKDFLFFAKNNWQTPPQYVLVIGDGSYDPRNYEGFGYWDLVPAMLFDAIDGETASDDALVDFNDDGLAELAIGRIPARTSGDVTNALSKTMTFEQPGGQDLSRGALFAYHGSSPTYDFGGMSQRLSNQLPAGTPATFVSDQDANAQSTLITQMNSGKFLVNFSGHGALGSWVGPGFFSLNQVPQLTNIDHPSVFTMLTCLNGYFVLPNGGQSLAEYLLNWTGGGAAASWASSGTTTPDIQEIMATRFYQKVGAGQIQRLGDLIVDAKTVVPGGRDVRLSWVLIGDPMLKVR